METDISIIDWIYTHRIKNEKGDLMEFHNHLFLWDIYLDQSQYLCVMKPAQVGLSTLEVLKNLYDARRYKMDIIYTLPTDTDVNTFVGGKVNRIISSNPILMEYTKDKDSVEQKQVGESMIYFRGTFTPKAAIMVTADRLVHDEKDSSKQSVVKDFEARLQHSKFKQKHVFSHPSVPGNGVDVEWQDSDQKHWFITCPTCKKQQYLSWNTTDKTKMSVDIERKIFVCKSCGGELSNKDRAVGVWKPKIFRDADGNIIKKKYSGYWISLLMAPWVSAEEIVAKFNDPDVTDEFFHNKVLGLPYLGSGNKLTKEYLMQNLTSDVIMPSDSERHIMGVDTGLKLDYVMGSEKGLYFHGDAKDYDELDKHMKDYPKMMAFVDGGGDLIGSRKFQARWPGRVWLCYFGGDKATTDKATWNEKERTIAVDRNKYIQLCVDEFIDGRIPLQGDENDWYDYFLDWNNLHRIKILDPVTGAFKGYKWVRNGRDHRALATTLWRVGLTRFRSSGGKILTGEAPTIKTGPEIQPDNTIAQSHRFQYTEEDKSDWRT
jgi:hypothetical protein